MKVQYLLYSIVLMYFSCKSLMHVNKPVEQNVSVVFEPDMFYTSTRIPAIVISNKGTLIAFCEGRIGSSSDWADMHLLMRRSTDEGKTWGTITIIDSCKGAPVGNPVPIVGKDGIIHLLYQKDYNKGFYTYSDDDGLTWKKIVDITSTYNAFKPEYDWKVLAPGPGHGIQLSSGRLLSAVWLANSNKLVPRRSHAPSCVATIYSDDNGKTWKEGSITVDSSSNIANPNESMPVELSDGTVLLSIRNTSKNLRRAFSKSKSGIDNWSMPEFADEIFDPTCMASIISLRQKNKQNLLVFINPDSRNIKGHPRKNLSAKLSLDDGKTWKSSKVLDTGSSGYSDVAIDKNGIIYCLYESNTKEKNFNYSLVLKKFNAAWLLKNVNN